MALTFNRLSLLYNSDKASDFSGVLWMFRSSGQAAQVALCVLVYTTLSGHHSLTCQPLGLRPSVTLGQIVSVSLIIPGSLLSSRARTQIHLRCDLIHGLPQSPRGGE